MVESKKLYEDKKTYFNIYCDESCYLLNDISDYMGLGAISINLDSVKDFSRRIKKLKNEYNCNGELKWTKVSIKNVQFYLSLVDLFFTYAQINFRVILIENKKLLDHQEYNENSHDIFYYKMYYYLLKNILETNEAKYNIYLDIKETYGGGKIYNLKKILGNAIHDNDKVEKIQIIRSNESNILQVSDFLLGAVLYSARGIITNDAKLAVVEAIEQHTNTSICKTTPPWESKFNIFRFTPRRKN